MSFPTDTNRANFAAVAVALDSWRPVPWTFSAPGVTAKIAAASLKCHAERVDTNKTLDMDIYSNEQKTPPETEQGLLLPIHGAIIVCLPAEQPPLG